MGVVFIVVFALVFIIVLMFIASAEKDRKDLIKYNKFKHGIDTTRSGDTTGTLDSYKDFKIDPID